MAGSDLSNYPTASNTQPTDHTHTTHEYSHPLPWPFQNMSIYLLMKWLITDNHQKSLGEMDKLVSILHSSEFKQEDLVGFSAQQENWQINLLDNSVPDKPFSHDSWIESSIQVSIPTAMRESGGQGQPFIIPGHHQHFLLVVMKPTFTGVTTFWFHFSPF